jgi:Lamin Tail Domain
VSFHRSVLTAVVTAALAAAALPAFAQTVRITEVAPWANIYGPYKADWFELTNTGSASVDISGWKFDDSSSNFGTSQALDGITVIGAGESVIFLEAFQQSPITIRASFLNTWFGTSDGPRIGSYNGAGVGLNVGGDSLNIFDGSGRLQARVLYGPSDSLSPFQTFDNAAGLNNTTISLLSEVGTNGAFVALNDIQEIGSPGLIAAVPGPESYAFMLAGLALAGAIARKRNKN